MKHSWKQKPEKPKDAATRNLTAELEAVATTTNAVSPKASSWNGESIEKIKQSIWIAKIFSIKKSSDLNRFGTIKTLFPKQILLTWI